MVHLFTFCRHPCGSAINQLLIYCIPLLPDQALMFCYAKPTVILGLFGLLQKEKKYYVLGWPNSLSFYSYIFCVYHD